MAPYDNEAVEAQMKEILSKVVAGKGWSDTEAGSWTKEAQSEIFQMLKKDGYKIVVLCEALSKGSGCVKQQYSLISADDCVVQAQITNDEGVMMYALAVATKYT
eukprot:TRINITY_DN794_c0_g1_i1.p3 TRINITY_DN794_c0_g1~~TRINITY_DN794_c0_g1_i1.p3  ORF type:complete len:104 (+),score=42.92 TRINITY_DN794_c0_g1_i1:65-376(+)